VPLSSLYYLDVYGTNPYVLIWQHVSDKENVFFL
jgi:hypothetical protein